MIEMNESNAPEQESPAQAGFIHKTVYEVEYDNKGLDIWSDLYKHTKEFDSYDEARKEAENCGGWVSRNSFYEAGEIRIAEIEIARKCAELLRYKDKLRPVYEEKLREATEAVKVANTFNYQCCDSVDDQELNWDIKKEEGLLFPFLYYAVVLVVHNIPNWESRQREEARESHRTISADIVLVPARVPTDEETDEDHAGGYNPCYTGYYVMFEGKERSVTVLYDRFKVGGAKGIEVRSFEDGSKLGIVLDVIGNERDVLLFKGGDRNILSPDIMSDVTRITQAERDKLFDYENVWSDLVGCMSYALGNTYDQKTAGERVRFGSAEPPCCGIDFQ